MLRMPSFELHRPAELSEALRLLSDLAPDVQCVAGGTDLVPNLKHELFTPKHVVALGQVEGLRGVRVDDDGTLVLRAATTLAEVSAHPEVLRRAPALAQAAGLVAGPQLRRMGTLGGNVLLDTRCQWYNQSYFWREALGFCMKKDGTKCHVVEGGSKCVAAASNDTAPALMTLGAQLVIEKHGGKRVLPIDEFWRADGIYNKKLVPGEILTEVRIPPTGPGHRGAYGKLRDRGSIDFPLLGVAVALELDGSGTVSGGDAVFVALQARPIRIKGVGDRLAATRPGEAAFEEAVERVCEQAFKQCHPMPNIPGDHDYRREMVPVYLRHTLRAAAAGEGPIHGL